MMNTLSALAQSTRGEGPRTLTLHYDEPHLTTVLALEDGAIRGVQGPVTPSWHTTLRHHGVHPVTLLEAQEQARSLDDALGYLLRRGVVTTGELATLARDRVLHALLPLTPHPARVTVQTGSGAGKGSAVAPHVPVRDCLLDLTRLHEPGRPQAVLRLTQAYAASPARVVASGEDTPDALVYRAALQGWTLREMGHRLPLRWDLLRQTVGRLTATGDIWPAEHHHTVTVQPRLRVGAPAPDFVLPALGGGELRLSTLRGQRVWLSFNRQSTCALCNPHHAAVIALQSELVPLGVQTVSLWGSTVADLAHGIGRQQPPYPVLADPADHTYARYGLTHSLRGTLDPRNLGTMLQGLKMMGKGALKSDGELLRMPAEFLIGADGHIERAHYAAFGADFLPLEEVLAWARQP